MFDDKRREFNNYIVRQTFKYQKKYGFELGEGKEKTHNNEADAFKHTYLSAYLTVRHGDLIASMLGNLHETETPNAPKYETNMDNWNNEIGRQIGKEIKEDIKGKHYSQSQIEDMIAEKVMQKMRKGELITNPYSDIRKFVPKELLDNIFDLPNKIHNKKKSVTLEEMKDPKVFKDFLEFISRQCEAQNNANLQKRIAIDKIFDNKNKIIYRGEININDLEPKSPLFYSYVDQITDLKPFPTKAQLDERVKSGELIYVEEYVRSDGTRVSGYFRSYPKS